MDITLAKPEWYQAGLATKVDESYAPLEVVRTRLVAIIDFIELLTVGRLIPNNHDLAQMPQCRYLRKRYFTVLSHYRHHNDKHQRGWDVPPWLSSEDVPIAGGTNAVVRGWTLDRWYATERDVPSRLLATHVDAARARGEVGRIERRVWNTTALLLCSEVEAIRLALNDDME